MEDDEEIIVWPTCDLCHRERTKDDKDYSPLQVMTGQPVVWYSGDDGELCPDDFQGMMELGR